MSKRNAFLKFVHEGIEDFTEEQLAEATKVLKGEVKQPATTFTIPTISMGTVTSTNANKTFTFPVEMKWDVA